MVKKRSIFGKKRKVVVPTLVTIMFTLLVLLPEELLFLLVLKFFISNFIWVIWVSILSIFLLMIALDTIPKF